MTALKSFSNRLQVFMLDKLARACARMSFNKKRRLAGLIATLARPLPWLRFKQVSASLAEHLDLVPEAAAAMAEKVFRHFLINSFEMAGLKFYSRDEIIQKIRCEGLENLQNALAPGKGVIIVSGHFGLWEFIPLWLATQGFAITTVVRRQNNPLVDTWFEEMRQQHGARTTDSGYGIREILKSLRRGHILALMVDQDNGKQGIFVKFFRRWASAPTGPAQISLKTGSPIVPLALFPNYRGKHLLKIWPAIFPDRYSDDISGQQALTAEFTSIIESIITIQPENWFWLHRRWKTGPQDAPDNPWAKLVLTSTHDAGDNN